MIGTDEEASTLFTTSNELIKLGFIGVSTVRGGFEAVKYEVEQGKFFLDTPVTFISYSFFSWVGRASTVEGSRENQRPRRWTID